MIIRLLFLTCLLLPSFAWADDFGVTSIGGSDTYLASTDLFCARGTAPGTGDVDSVTVYVGNLSASPATHFKGVILEDAAGFAIIANGVTPATAVGTRPGWMTANFTGTKPTVTNGTNYYICAIGNSGELQLQYQTGAGFYDADNNYTTPNSGASGGTDTNAASIYASMTIGGGGAQNFFYLRRPQ